MIMLLSWMLAGCVSTEKEQVSTGLDVKAMSSASALVQTLWTDELYDLSSGAPVSIQLPPVFSDNETKISWSAPSTNADGTPLTDLAGYALYYGLGEDSFDVKDRPNIPVPKDSTSMIIFNLPSGRWCFQVTAIDAFNNESDFSDGACRTVP
jgi:hypothetical protein